MKKLNWKKIVAGTLSAVMLLSVTACGSSNGKSESASTETGKESMLQRLLVITRMPDLMLTLYSHRKMVPQLCVHPVRHSLLLKHRIQWQPHSIPITLLESQPLQV